MPLPRFFKLPQREQDRLLEIAGAEFGRHGYAEASLNRILAKAKLSKGALYYYFSDKDDLYAAVVERAVSGLGDVLAGFAPKTAKEFWPAVEAFAAKGFELARRHPEEMKRVRSFQRDVRLHRRPAFEPVVAMVREQFRRLVRRGRELGCVRDDLDEELLVELIESVDALIDARLFSEPDPFGRATARRYAALSVDLGRRLVDPTLTLKEKRP
jgi:AcrR family transcriptional regulator